MLSSIAEIVRDLLIFVVAMTVLLITLVVVISKMPDSNRLKRLLTALRYRLGATLAVAAAAIPLEPIAGPPPGQRGSTPAATVSGPSRAASWSAPAQLKMAWPAQ
jgi:hypothetical protein